VDITWLGHAAVRVRTRQAAVVMDPTDRSDGIDMARPGGDIATISRVDQRHHNHVKGIKGDPIIVDGPGEYEILGVQIEGVRALWPMPEGEADAVPEATTLYICQAEELRFAHLGGLGQPPTPAQSEALSGVDILILPIALPGGLAPEAAARVARAIEPKMVIPVGYLPDAKGNSEELKVFLEAIGTEPEEAVSRLTVNRRNLGDTRRIALLESRG
jgi:L-ascorbate metabolism protein UlaG (beta-lactamase superfamily)